MSGTYLFVVGEEEDGVYATIVDEKFFRQHGYVEDQHITANCGGPLLDIPGWDEEAESYFLPTTPMTAAQAHQDLESKGFVFDGDFYNFICDSTTSTPYKPKGRRLPNSKKSTKSNNVRTEACKQAICDLINGPSGGTVLATAYNGSPSIQNFLQNCWLFDDRGNQIIVNSIDDVIEQGGNPKNWRRFVKEKASNSCLGEGPAGAIWVRGFDCHPFVDQLRAYVWDDGKEILKVEIVGE